MISTLGTYTNFGFFFSHLSVNVALPRRKSKSLAITDRLHVYNNYKNYTKKQFDVCTDKWVAR